MASVICIAGLDPTGHAGLSVDIRALESLDVVCHPVASALTVQNSKNFLEIQPVPVDLVTKQLDAILDVESPGAVKLGVLGSVELALMLSDYFGSGKIPVITDPVFRSTTGFNMVDDTILETYLHDIIPISAIVTPNADEARAITGLEVDAPEDAVSACQNIFDLGPGSVLLKGGHFKKSVGTDVFFDSEGSHLLQGKQFSIKVRGTGCAYSSLIAGHISAGSSMLQSFKKAKTEMNAAISRSASQETSILRFK
jgi:hydroxymethylpyrimidine/phosphomethylpyrimidine kinase